MSIYH